MQQKTQSQSARISGQPAVAKKAFVVVAAAALPAVTALGQTGDVAPVHDPCVIKQGDTFYVFTTGRNLSIRKSTDLLHWTRIGDVFAQPPAWAVDAFPQARDQWAPDISFTNGEYRLYYAVSRFGTSHSTIGLVTNVTLDPADAKYKWVDRGPIISTKVGDNFNAIDPAAFTDATGQAWLALGSYWTGLKLFKVDAATGKIVDGDQPRSIAARPGSTAIEAPFISRHDDFYYLWVSFDQCCKGAASTYNTRVGRSKNVEGPYVDRDGRPMLQGGGTVVLESEGDFRGPGHCAVLSDGGVDYLVHHWYDASRRGRRTLGVRKIVWDAAGWPSAPAALSPTTRPTPAEIAGWPATRPASRPATP